MYHVNEVYYLLETFNIFQQTNPDLITQFTTFRNLTMKEYKLSKSKYTKNKNHTCDGCLKAFNSMSHWKYHIKNNQLYMSLYKFKCISCKCIGTNDKRLNQHLYKYDICHYFDKHKRVTT